MIIKRKTETSDIFAIAILTIVVNVAALFLYSESSTSLIVGVIMLIYSVMVFSILRKRHNFSDSVLYLSILSIPTSFISILGTSYASLPISWFVLCIMVLSLLSIKTGKTLKSFIPVFIVGIYFLISVFVHGIAQDSLKQIVNIMIYFLAIPVSYYFIAMRNLNQRRQIVNTAKVVYIISALSYALTIIFQALYIQATGDVVGTYDAFGGGRTSYAALFSDYSFASLFLASAAILIFYNIYSRDMKYSKLLSVVLLGFLIYAILLTTARTGLLALALSAFMVLVYMFVNNKKAFLRVAALLSIVVAAFLASYLFSVVSDARGGQDITDGSNRIEDYQVALNLFSDSILTGIGFGLERYTGESSGVPVPHNFFIQYLVQGGMLGLLIIIVSMIVVFISRWKYDRALVFMSMLMFIGGMFIPDLLHSRAILIVTILILISSVPRVYKSNTNIRGV